MKKEYIICCAIPMMDINDSDNWPSFDEKEFVLGYTHSKIKNRSIALGIKLLSDISDKHKGFLTSELRYVYRGEAAEIAYEAKQIKEPKDELFSDDLNLEHYFNKYISDNPEQREFLKEMF